MFKVWDLRQISSHRRGGKSPRECEMESRGHTRFAPSRDLEGGPNGGAC